MNNTSLDTSQISGKLLAYLRDELKNPEIDYAENLKQLQGGYETAIYPFQVNYHRQSWWLVDDAPGRCNFTDAFPQILFSTRLVPSCLHHSFCMIIFDISGFNKASEAPSFIQVFFARATIFIC